MVDISYGGENGFNQAIELAAESLANVKFIQEKKLIGNTLTKSVILRPISRQDEFSMQVDTLMRSAKIPANTALGSTTRLKHWN